MRRFFVKNILFVIAVNILVKPVWVFFIDRNVQNMVPPGDYGTYQALMSLSIIFQTILDFGITNYNSRTIAMHPEKLDTLFPAMLSARLALMIFYVTIAFGGGYILGYRGWELWLLAGVLTMQSLNALVMFLRSNISALHRFKTDGLLSAVDRLLMVVFCTFLFILPATRGRFRIEWFIIAQIFSYLLASIAAYIVLWSISKVKLRFSLQPKEVLRIMKQSLPYALLIFQMSVYNRADAMMIERMGTHGKIQADIWAAAFRLLEVTNMFGLIFATMLLPVFGRMLARKEDVHSIIRLCVNIMLPVSFIIAVLCGFYSVNIMPMLYKACTQRPELAGEYIFVFGILMASFPAWCMMYVYSTLLTASGNLKDLNLIACAGVILNLSLNFWLIPKYGASGGAITSFVTQTVLAIIFMVFAWRIIKLPFDLKWAGAHAGFLLLIFGLAYTVHRFALAYWLIQMLATGVMAVGLLFTFRFVSVASIKEFLSNKDG